MDPARTVDAERKPRDGPVAPRVIRPGGFERRSMIGSHEGPVLTAVTASAWWRRRRTRTLAAIVSRKTLHPARTAGLLCHRVSESALARIGQDQLSWDRSGGKTAGKAPKTRERQCSAL